jgi:hypothetical protein
MGAIPITDELLRLRAKISAYDPTVIENMKRVLPKSNKSEKLKMSLMVLILP